MINTRFDANRAGGHSLIPEFDAERDRRIRLRASQLLQSDVALRVLTRVEPHKARMEAIAMASAELDAL